MEENTLVEFSGRAGVCDPLTDLPRKGAHQLLRAAVASGLETRFWPSSPSGVCRMVVLRLCATVIIPNAPCRPVSAR